MSRISIGSILYPRLRPIEHPPTVGLRIVVPEEIVVAVVDVQEAVAGLAAVADEVAVVMVAGVDPVAATVVEAGAGTNPLFIRNIQAARNPRLSCWTSILKSLQP